MQQIRLFLSILLLSFSSAIFAETFTPSDKELNSCSHVIMSSPHEWNPHNVQFHSQARQFEDEMAQNYQISQLIQ